MPLSTKLDTALLQFQRDKSIRGKGALAVVLHISRVARDEGLPLNSQKLVTDGAGQVLGLGKGAIQKILLEHGVTQVLAEEGGRTSRGSMGTMHQYVEFLNALQLDSASPVDMSSVETWWVERVREHFSAKPFRLKYDASKSLQAIIQDLLAQAKKRQQESTGTMYQGAMLQHLVGAKLELVLPSVVIVHHGASVADAVSDRSGDFVIDDCILHVTTAPGEAVVRKCQQNLEDGVRPIILTIGDGVAVARALANNLRIAGRVEILDAEQFIAANIHELSLFSTASRRPTLEALVAEYNRIVSTTETDPSLRIDIG